MTTEAVIAFFKTLGEGNVPPERIAAKLIEIAFSFEATRQRLSALNPDDPVTKALVDQARTELEHGHTDAASALLERAEEADLAAAAQARTLAHQASAAADARQLHAAKARERRGDIALTQLRYREAAGYFGRAISSLPDSASSERGRLLFRRAVALYFQGDEYGDNAALCASIQTWRLVLLEHPGERLPRDWAMIQNHLGNALAALGERESGTARLEEAVAAYRDALKEQTRERVRSTGP